MECFADDEAIVLFFDFHDGTGSESGFVEPFAGEADEGDGDVMAVDVPGASYLVLGPDGEEAFGFVFHMKSFLTM